MGAIIGLLFVFWIIAKIFRVSTRVILSIFLILVALYYGGMFLYVKHLNNQPPMTEYERQKYLERHSEKVLRDGYY